MGLKSSKGKGKGRDSVEGKRAASNCNQKGLCGVVILCREGWQCGSSQITLDFLLSNAAIRPCVSLSMPLAQKRRYRYYRTQTGNLMLKVELTG